MTYKTVNKSGNLPLGSFGTNDKMLSSANVQRGTVRKDRK